MNEPHRASPHSRTLLRACVIGGAYLSFWTLLDGAARVFVVPELGVSIWYPAPGLHYALLLLAGLRFAPLLLAPVLWASLEADAGALTLTLFFVNSTIVYAGAAWVMRHRLGVDPFLRSRADVMRLLGVGALAAPLVAAILQGALYVFGGLLPAASLPEFVLAFWVGDATGIAALTPALLLAGRLLPAAWRPGTAERTPPPLPNRTARAHVWLEAALLLGVVGLVHVAMPAGDVNYSLLVFLPLLYIATRRGFALTSFLVLFTNVAVVAAVLVARLLRPDDALSVLSYQIELMALTFTSLVLAAFVSERRRYLERLEVAHEESDRLARLRDALLRNLSHEVRTPLTSIIGYSTLMLDDEITSGPAQRRTMLDAIQRNGRRLLTTLDLVLNLSTLEAQHIVPQLSPTDVRTLVRDIADLLEVQAREKGLAFELDLPDEALRAHVDPQIVRGIVHHLVDNAIKFTVAGAVVVRLEESPDGPEDTLVIGVDDTGEGMTPEALSFIYDDFWQASEGMGRIHEGLGLGLSITRRLVELAGGTIAVESMPGHGSRFRVHLPRRQPELPQPQPTDDTLA